MRTVTGAKAVNTSISMTSNPGERALRARRDNVIDQKAAMLSTEDAGRVHGKEMIDYVNLAWDMLDQGQKIELADQIHTVVWTFLRSPGAAVCTKSIAQEIVEGMVKEEIEARTPEIRERIEKEVSERWEQQVESVVRARLEAAIAKIRQEMIK